MIFQGIPGMTITISRPRIGEKKRFQFDANGLYETHHPFTVKRMIGKFPVVGQMPEEAAPVKLNKCKKCEFATENMGDLLAHYRKEHPKED